jgi:hypothetical protein
MRAREQNQDEHANQNSEVRQVEYAGVKWPGPDHHEIGNQPVMNETVNEVANATGRGQQGELRETAS